MLDIVREELKAGDGGEGDLLAMELGEAHGNGSLANAGWPTRRMA